MGDGSAPAIEAAPIMVEREQPGFVQTPYISDVVKEFFQAVLPDAEATPGAVVAIQTFGELLNIHPHLHVLASDGGFDPEGNFYQLPSWLDMNRLAELFRHKVLRMLLSKGKITEALVENLLSWPHSGFHVHQGERIEADDRAGRERVAAYILRAPLSQERMTYREETGEVIVLSGKKGKEKKVFDALDWLAALTAHIPNRGEQRVRYYGWYSNKSWGIRKKAEQEEGQAPLVVLPERSDKQHRLYWAQLIQKVYEVDPLVCPKCQGKMKIVSFIEDPEVIRKILVHLGLWEIPPRAPPRSSPAFQEEVVCDYDFFDALVN
ncbi:MAG: transposase [Candidatus Binatia bacterium]